MKRGPVLACIDLGEASAGVITTALAVAGAGEVLIAHAFPDPFLLRTLFRESALELEEVVQRHLERLAARFQDPTPEATLRIGEPYARMVELAEERGASLIVVGAPSAPSGWFASTAERIVRYAPCPVLIHRNSAAGPILAATDLSNPSMPALEAAVEVATRTSERVVAVHVVEVDRTVQTIAFTAAVVAASIPATIDEPDLMLAADAALRASVAAHAPGATCEVVIGQPTASVLKRAQELRASVVVVATRGRTGLARVALGSIAESIVRMAPCSVLVARHQSATPS